MRNDSTEILFHPFSARGHHEQVLHRQRCHRFFGVVHPAFPLPTTKYVAQAPICPERWFLEAVVARDMPKPCEFPSLDSCQKRFLLAHMAVDLVLHPEGQTDIIGAQRHRRVYTETLRDRDDNYEKKYKI